MKKNFLKGAALFLFAGFISCTNDEIIEQNQSGEFCVEATMGLVESRTYPEAYEENGKTKYHTNWHSEDAIYVFGERVKGTLTLQNGAGSTNGKFYGRVYGDSRNLAYSAYPAEFIVTNSAGEVTGFEMTEIDYIEGNTMAPMFGEFVTSKKVEFQHLVGMLKVEIDNIPENSTLEVFGAGICGKADLVINANGEYSLVPEDKTTKIFKIKNIPSGNHTLFVPIYIANPNAEGIDAKHIGIKLNGNTFKPYPFINTMVGQVTAKNMPKLVWNENAAASESKLQELKTWDGSAKSEEVTKDNTTGEYVIDSTEKLLGFASQVNAGVSFAGETVTLATNIDLNNQPWTPVSGFKGTFDGQNHIISNLTINGEGKIDQGLFGKTTDGEIKNLTVNNAKVSGYLNVGVVAGTPYTSKYSNIKVTGHVEVNGFAYVGAVGGKDAYANWDNITVNVDETSYVNANSENYRTYVGGVIGFNGEGGHSFKNITSNIDVKGSTIDVGGLFGIAHYGNQFENCICTGDVEIYAAKTAEYAEEIGGIAGVWNNGGSDVVFTNCSFTGEVRTNVERGTIWYNNLVGKPYTSTGNGKLIINGSEVIANGVSLNNDGEYLISNAYGMFWFAKEVNESKNAFIGKTVKLVADIDLTNAAWTPIGQTGATTFNGVFDGQDFTISDLNIDSDDQTGKNYSSGLFGWVETHTEGCGIIKNVKIDGANIKGHHNCGALVGYITEKYAIVENCHVAYATISCTYANGDAAGDKAGALIGNATVATTVKNCTASNSTVSAGRDSGQVIGAGKEANVTGCSATKVTVTANGTGTGANVRNEVIGRLL